MVLAVKLIAIVPNYWGDSTLSSVNFGFAINTKL